MRSPWILVGLSALLLASCDGCQSKPPEPSRPPPVDGPTEPAGKAALDQSGRTFERRKKYTRLTLPILASIPDDQLEQAVIDFVDHKLGDHEAVEERHWRGLSKGLRAVHATWWVEAEVYNGGFNQYFWNPAGRHAADAAAGFKLMGEEALARLMEQAIRIERADAARRKKFEDRGTLEAFSESYQEDPLGKLDEQFGVLAEKLPARRLAFIRARPELFTGE